MKWRWRRRKESAEIAEAQQYIDQLKRQQPEVTRKTRDLQRVGQRNHFAEWVSAALRGAP